MSFFESHIFFVVTCIFQAQYLGNFLIKLSASATQTAGLYSIVLNGESLIELNQQEICFLSIKSLWSEFLRNLIANTSPI